MLIGGKNFAWFDLWSLQHFVVGVTLGRILKDRQCSYLTLTLLTVAIAYCWEVIEYGAEIGMFGSLLMTWFGGVEFFWNRVLVDPLVFLFGAYFGYKFSNKTFHVASVSFASFWLLSNIFFNSTNDLQSLVFNLFS